MGNILFSAKISSKHRDNLTKNFPDQSFIFCNNIDEAKTYLSEADVLVTYGEDVTDDAIEQAGNLKWIMVLSAGVEQLPFKTIEARNIVVTNARGIHKTPMAEYAISMLLQVYRQAKTIIKNESDNYWDKSVRMNEISGKTVLVAGAGAIGQEVARLAKAFQMKTIGISKSGRNVEHFDENYSILELDKMLPSADFVVAVMPSTSETRHCFAFQQFELMPNHVVFLNMGRGDAVKSKELLEAVRNGEIAHAILDVFDEEPLPASSPFWQEENITVTPHISGVSPKYVTRALEIFMKNLCTFQEEGTVYINQIDLTRGY